jgi:hypothetical protein
VAGSVIAVNSKETQPTIDGILTLAILWLIYCREHASGRLFEDLKLIIPQQPPVPHRLACPGSTLVAPTLGIHPPSDVGFAASIARDPLGDDRSE